MSEPDVPTDDDVQTALEVLDAVQEFYGKEEMRYALMDARTTVEEYRRTL